MKERTLTLILLGLSILIQTTVMDWNLYLSFWKTKQEQSGYATLNSPAPHS